VRRAFSSFTKVSPAPSTATTAVRLQQLVGAVIEARSESIGCVGRRILVPRVIVLLVYDRLPKTRVRSAASHLRARREHLPVLLPDPAALRAQLGPRYPAVARRQDHLGERGLLLRALQPQEGRPDAVGGRDAPVQGPARPRWTPLLRVPLRKATYREWLPFLSLAEASYWNVELLED